MYHAAPVCRWTQSQTTPNENMTMSFLVPQQSRAAPTAPVALGLPVPRLSHAWASTLQHGGPALVFRTAVAVFVRYCTIPLYPIALSMDYNILQLITTAAKPMRVYRKQSQEMSRENATQVSSRIQQESPLSWLPVSDGWQAFLPLLDASTCQQLLRKPCQFQQSQTSFWPEKFAGW